MGNGKEVDPERFAMIVFERESNMPAKFRGAWLDTETGEVFIAADDDRLFLMAAHDGIEMVRDGQGVHRYPVSWLMRNTESKYWESAINAWEKGFRKLFPQHAEKLKDYRPLLRHQPAQEENP